VSDDIELDYDFLMQNALRYLMRDVLTIVADLGDAPGEHHFYIEFLTGAPGVDIPAHLKQDYPERMTIVLQHQFEHLIVTDKGFSITLWFKGKESPLKIPFNAVTSFADPSVKFGLRFVEAEESADAGQSSGQSSGKSDGEAEKPAAENAPGKDSGKKSSAAPKTGDSADIVSLDAFRKK